MNDELLEIGFGDQGRVSRAWESRPLSAAKRRPGSLVERLGLGRDVVEVDPFAEELVEILVERRHESAGPVGPSAPPRIAETHCAVTHVLGMDRNELVGMTGFGAGPA